jgi:hypothetical protein
MTECELCLDLGGIYLKPCCLRQACLSCLEDERCICEIPPVLKKSVSSMVSLAIIGLESQIESLEKVKKNLDLIITNY